MKGQVLFFEHIAFKEIMLASPETDKRQLGAIVKFTELGRLIIMESDYFCLIRISPAVMQAATTRRSRTNQAVRSLMNILIINPPDSIMRLSPCRILDNSNPRQSRRIYLRRWQTVGRRLDLAFRSCKSTSPSGRHC